MARASYQHIPNISLGKPKKQPQSLSSIVVKKKKRTVVMAPPSSTFSKPKPIRPILSLFNKD